MKKNNNRVKKIKKIEKKVKLLKKEQGEKRKTNVK